MCFSMSQDDEELMISPVKIDPVPRPNTPTASVSNNMQDGRAYSGGLGSNVRALGVSQLRSSVK